MSVAFTGPVLLMHSDKVILDRLKQLFSQRYEVSWSAYDDGYAARRAICGGFGADKSLIVLGDPTEGLDVVGLVNRYGQPQGQANFVILSRTPELLVVGSETVTEDFARENLFLFRGTRLEWEQLCCRLDEILGFH